MPEEQPPEKRENALGGIFGNARKTSIGLNYKTAETRARKCPSCGAARPDDTDLRACDFCGHIFMQLDTVVHVLNNASGVISAEDWIFINIIWSRGRDLNTLLELMGLELPQWEAATRHWSQLMHDGDTQLNNLFTTMQQQPFTGKYAHLEQLLSSPAIIKIHTEEHYIKIQEHLLAAERAGIDRLFILQEYGLSIEEWSLASGHYLLQQSLKMERLHLSDQAQHATYADELSRLHHLYKQQFDEVLKNNYTPRPEF